MIYTTQPGESFDAEILRQELVAALGSTGWHINTAGNTVEFTYRQEWLSELAFAGTAPTVVQLYADAEAVILAHFANGAPRETNKTILKQIAVLEARQTPRRVREGGAWLANLEVQISALRKQLK